MKQLSWLTIVTVGVENIPQIVIQISNATISGKFSAIMLVSVTISSVVVLAKVLKMMFLTAFSGVDDFHDPNVSPDEKKRRKMTLNFSDFFRKKSSEEEDGKPITKKEVEMSKKSSNKIPGDDKGGDVKQDLVDAGIVDASALEPGPVGYLPAEVGTERELQQATELPSTGGVRKHSFQPPPRGPADAAALPGDEDEGADNESDGREEEEGGGGGGDPVNDDDATVDKTITKHHYARTEKGPKFNRATGKWEEPDSGATEDDEDNADEGFDLVIT